MKNTIPFILLLFPILLSAQNTNVSGMISNAQGTIVQSVEVSLLDEQGQLITTQMTTNGRYTFEGLPAGYNYIIRLNKGGTPLNGLSTLDFVMIARHIIGIDPLGSELQIRTADIDGNGQVSVVDLVYLRHLILSIISELPNQRNWLFIAEDGTPPNSPQANSFSFYLQGGSITKNFLIQKVGDLNDNAVYN
ncbi:MAG: hypothetical protein R2824_08640 [Saprospiraceae bacterium]|nr:hypothetical protein [Lewinella sp.]